MTTRFMRIITLTQTMKQSLLEMDMDANFVNTFLNVDFLVIEEDKGKITGLAGVGGLFHIGGIFVKKEFRGKGIARKLNQVRDQELKKRGYSFFIGTTFTKNPNSKEISNILKDRKARPVFAFSYYDGFITTIYIQEFNWKGKFLGKLLGFFNTKFGTAVLALFLKTAKPFWNNMFLADASSYPKINLSYSIKNFKKIENKFND